MQVRKQGYTDVNARLLRLSIPRDTFTLNGLSADQVTADDGFSWSGIKQAGQDLITAWNAQRVFDLNIERMQRNQPPIPPAYAAPAVNVGLTPQTQQLLMYGGLALLAVLLLKRAG